MSVKPSIVEIARRRKSPIVLPPWTEAEARAILAEHAASGQSIWLFARSRKLPAKRLYDWQRKFLATGTPAVPATLAAPAEEPRPLVEASLFVPVRLTSPVKSEVEVKRARPQGREKVAGDSVLELVVTSHRVVRIPQGFDEGTLSRLLRVLDGEA